MSNPYTPHDLYFAYRSVMVNYRMRQDDKRKKLAALVADKLLGIVRCRNCNEAMPMQDAVSWKSGDGWLCDECVPF